MQILTTYLILATVALFIVIALGVAAARADHLMHEHFLDLALGPKRRMPSAHHPNQIANHRQLSLFADTAVAEIAPTEETANAEFAAE